MAFFTLPSHFQDCEYCLDLVMSYLNGKPATWQDLILEITLHGQRMEAIDAGL